MPTTSILVQPATAAGAKLGRSRASSRAIGGGASSKGGRALPTAARTAKPLVALARGDGAHR
jgi:hypothetical protein